MELLYNAIRTPDGTVLVSRNRHDYKEHTDANGKYYAVDGGHAYQRILGDVLDIEDLSVYSTDPIERIREHYEWGSYGKSGTEPLHYIKLKDMSDDHIIACMENLKLPKVLIDIFLQELEYRKK